MDPSQAAALVATGSGVLVPDTCALVDLVRVIERHSSPTKELDAAKRVLTATKTGLVSVVVPDLVPKEWGDHVAEECDRQVAWIQSLEQRATRVLDSDSFLSGTPAGSVSLSVVVVDKLKQLALDIIAGSIPADSTDAIHLAAYHRQASGRGPARKGKDCIKDCNIAEVLLEVSRCLKPRHSAKIVFLTSNKSDFCDPLDDRRPHPDLQADFAAFGIDLVRTWQWAATVLGV